MSSPRLTEEQVNEVIQRAAEIDHQLQHRLTSEDDVQRLIATAEEAGLSREAVLQALSEQVGMVGEPPKVGELVFALSADKKMYVAKVLEVTETALRVEFLNGGSASISNKDVRPFSITPGSKVICRWPDWGDWTCTVVRIDMETQRVRVTDGWGSERTVPLAEVKVDPQKSALAQRLEGLTTTMKLTYATGGGLIGALVTWLLMRR